MPPTARVLRHTTFDRALEHHLRDWIDVLPDQPTVYATLGTAHNHLTDIFRAIIAGLQERPINLILTVGRNGDPAAFGPVPPNVHIERYIPQSLLLPHCDVAVFHAGWSTTLGALTHGPPQVLAPITADQPENAQRCAALGVGLIVHPNERTPEAIGKAVQAVLDEPSFGE